MLSCHVSNIILPCVGRGSDPLFGEDGTARAAAQASAKASIAFYTGIFADWGAWVAELARNSTFRQRVRIMAGQQEGQLPSGASYSARPIADAPGAPAMGRASHAAQVWLMSSHTGLRDIVSQLVDAFWGGLALPPEEHGVRSELGVAHPKVSS